MQPLQVIAPASLEGSHASASSSQSVVGSAVEASWSPSDGRSPAGSVDVSSLRPLSLRHDAVISRTSSGRTREVHMGGALWRILR
jgi:hypothetical protein